MPDQPWPASVARRPVCPKRRLPIPFINEIAPDGTGLFAILDDNQARKCIAGRLCAVCGDPMGDEIAFLGDRVALDKGGYFIEAPVHEQCGLDSIGELCPFMSRERVPRRDHADESVTYVGIDPATLTQVGRTIAKRPYIMAICNTYTPAYTRNSAGQLSLVYQPGPRVRVRHFGWVDGRAAEVRAGPRRTQPRRTTRRQRRG